MSKETYKATREQDDALQHIYDLEEVDAFEDAKDLSIDRIDSSKGYSPENCRWANKVTQGQNTRRNVLDMNKVKEMRAEYKNNPSLNKEDMAIRYHVSKSTVWLVLNNRIWKES